jgi:hypothetical protein
MRKAVFVGRIRRIRLYKLLKAYRERPVTSSLLSRTRRTRLGARRLPQDIEAVVAEALQEFYATRQKPSVSLPVAGEYAAKCAYEIVQIDHRTPDRDDDGRNNRPNALPRPEAG